MFHLRMNYKEKEKKMCICIVKNVYMCNMEKYFSIKPRDDLRSDCMPGSGGYLRSWQLSMATWYYGPTGWVSLSLSLGNAADVVVE